MKMIKMLAIGSCLFLSNFSAFANNASIVTIQLTNHCLTKLCPPIGFTTTDVFDGTHWAMRNEKRAFQYNANPGVTHTVSHTYYHGPKNYHLSYDFRAPSEGHFSYYPEANLKDACPQYLTGMYGVPKTGKLRTPFNGTVHLYVTSSLYLDDLGAGHIFFSGCKIEEMPA